MAMPWIANSPCSADPCSVEHGIRLESYAVINRGPSEREADGVFGKDTPLCTQNAFSGVLRKGHHPTALTGLGMNVI